MRSAVLGLLAVVLVVTVARPTPTAAAADQTSHWQTGVVRFEPQPGVTVAVEGIGELRGTVEVRRGAAGIAVINEVPLDEYLLGLAEVPSTWPAAALEAQVIAARTFAVRTARTPSSAAHRAAGADICATESCQVYQGVERERRDIGGAWAAAVRATSNRVLLHGGAPILAKYASSNGGHSDYGGYPYLPATPDPDDAAVSPHASWQSVIPLADIERAAPGAGRLVEVNRAGDVVALRREQPDGTIVDQGMAPLDFRRALNGAVPTPVGVPVPVPSHRFVAHTQGDAVVLDGSGYGHLVGMSQYGALGKARRGMAADDILAAYYSGIRPTLVDPAALPPLIRVALELDASQVKVHPVGGRFRVRAADGAAIAQLVGGEWTVTPEADALNVAGTVRPIALRAERSKANAVRVWLDAAARLEVVDPTARSVGVLDAGTHDVPVADVEHVVIVADAGGGLVERAEVGPVARAHIAAVGARAVAVQPPPKDPAQSPAKTLPTLVAVFAGVVAAGGASRVRRIGRDGTTAQRR